MPILTFSSSPHPYYNEEIFISALLIVLLVSSLVLGRFLCRGVMILPPLVSRCRFAPGLTKGIRFFCYGRSIILPLLLRHGVRTLLFVFV